MYVNFNFLRINCKCGYDIAANLDLKKLAEQVLDEYNDLTVDSSNRKLFYVFKCPNCKKIVNRDLSVERRNSILIVE